MFKMFSVKKTLIKKYRYVALKQFNKNDNVFM